MSKKNKVALITVIWVIFCIPLFSNQIYSYSTDILFHLNRLVGINDAWNSGQLIPKIYPLTNNGYGYISPLFYCDLFLYPFAFLYRLGVPLIISYKCMLAIYSLVGTIVAYVCFDRLFKNTKTTIITLVLYSLANYRLIDCYSRQAFGEFLALNFCPLVILSIHELLSEKKENWKQLGIAFSLLLLSHNISFALYCLFFGITLLLFFVKEYKNKGEIIRVIVNTIKAVALALLLTCWFTLPMLEQLISNNLWVEEYGKMYDISNSYTELKTLLQPFVTLDYEWNIDVWDINPLGYVLTFTLIIGLFVGRDNNFKYLSLASLLFLSLAVGLIPLGKLHVFNFLQFSFRWYILIYPLSATVAGFVLSKINNKFITSICLAYVLLNVFNYDYLVLSNNEFQINNYETREVLFDINKSHKDYNETEISGAEYLPTSVINDYINDPKIIIGTTLDEPIEIIEINDYTQYKSGLKFESTSERDVGYTIPKTYYRGYKLVDVTKNQKVSIFCVEDFEKVGFVAEKGYHSYELTYSGTIIQKASVVISFVALCSLLVGVKKNGKEKSIICK